VNKQLSMHGGNGCVGEKGTLPCPHRRPAMPFLSDSHGGPELALVLTPRDKPDEYLYEPNWISQSRNLLPFACMIEERLREQTRPTAATSIYKSAPAPGTCSGTRTRCRYSGVSRGCGRQTRKSPTLPTLPLREIKQPLQSVTGGLSSFSAIHASQRPPR
jgi:hypothetical protein